MSRPQMRREQDRLKNEMRRIDIAWAIPANGREKVALLAPVGSTGAELGVDTGQLTRRFLELGHFSHFHAVDKWDDPSHTENQYLAVQSRLSKYSDITLWRCTAQKWLESQPDGSLGFVYIDCYAHTGQDDGSVLKAAWPKLQDGGIFAGDDYDLMSWPKTFSAVNRFAGAHGHQVNIRQDFCSTAKVRQDKHATWWFRK